ncbi:MAG TPA: alpha/beta fold hydrolase [Chloroflexia bacterium]|nr:alpha/beta fold hydrolase [Chloroflexia bacterium]
MTPCHLSKSRLHRLSLMSLVLLLTLVACEPLTPTSTPAPSPQAQYQPIYQQTECLYKVPAGLNVSCGNLVVPEDRHQPAGRKIQLHVAIVKSSSLNPAPDPVIFLQGGPGSSAIDVVFMLAPQLEPVLQQRDIIVFDQRGAGFSQPSLACSEDDLEQCRSRLVSEGINLAAYNTTENAADVNDLRLALGYRQVNLLGGSYGTRLALSVMRNHPAGLRSVILDSVVPPQLHYHAETVRNFETVLNNLFNACAVDTACNQKYPELKTVFYNLVQTLNAQPGSVQVSIPDRQINFTSQVSGDELVQLVWGYLYYPEAIIYLPEMIYETSQGGYEVLAELLKVRASMPDSTSRGMYLSVECTGQVSIESRVEVAKACSELNPVIRDGVCEEYLQIFDTCDVWAVPRADSEEFEPVKSPIPTLILSGYFDPATPPQYVPQVTQALSQHYNYIIPDGGHGVVRTSSCAVSIAEGFLNNHATAPDSNCLKQIKPLEFK